MKTRSSHPLVILTILIGFLGISTSGYGQRTLRIMALGNSLTAGENGDPSNPLTSEQMVAYRYGLKYLLEQGGYSVDFVGSQSDGSAFFNDCQHAGIPGTRDQYLERLLTDGYDERNGVQILNPARPYLDDFNPDIILLHIGTNDITHEADPIGGQRVSAILNLVDQYEIRSGNEVTVFLALIINRREPCYAGSGCGTTRNWNDNLESMAQARIAAGDKIVIVDMENDAGIDYASTSGDFTATDPQGLHLSPNGYGKMAALWYESIVSNINTPPNLSPIPDQSKTESEPFDVIPLDNYVYDVEDLDYELIWTATHLTTYNLNVVIDQNRNATVTRIDPAWAGEESIVFTVTDQGVNGSFQQSASDTVVFRMTAQNDLPVVTGQSDLSINEDQSIKLLLSDFTYYDADPDQVPEDFSLLVLPGSHYSVTGTTVQPEENYDVNLVVNVAVSDHVGPGPTYQALLQVQPVNDPPVVTGQPEIQMNEDESYMVNISMLEVSDADHDNSELELLMNAGAHYSIEDQTIVPDSNYNGVVYVESYVEDPEGGRTSAFYMEVTIKPVNDAPFFISEPEDTIQVGESYIYPFNAEDSDGEELSYNVISKPGWMTYYPNSRLLAGIPESQDVGFAQVKIRVTDGYHVVDQNFYLRVILGTGGEDLYSGSNEAQLYPNPSSDIFILRNTNTSFRGRFMLYDHLGRLIFEKQVEPNSETAFSAAHMEILPGIYIYSLQVGGECYSGKLLIQGKF